MLSLRKNCMDWTPSHLTSWASLFLTISSSNGKLFLPECWWLQPRGISSPASKILAIVDSLPSSRAGYILYLQANNYKLQILSFSIINLLSSASSSSSSSRISSDSSKSSSLLLGSKGRCCAADWLRFFAITRVLFFQPSEYRFLICQINGDYPPLITTLLKLQHSLLPVSAAACCNCCSSRRSCGICLRRSGLN